MGKSLVDCSVLDNCETSIHNLRRKRLKEILLIIPELTTEKVRLQEDIRDMEHCQARSGEAMFLSTLQRELNDVTSRLEGLIEERNRLQQEAQS